MLLLVESSMSKVSNFHIPWQYDLNCNMMSKPYPTGWIFYTHIDTRVDIRVQPMYQSNTGL
jgi:hypothetical protein